jgi:uncharacterized protein (UPF0332 family)
MFNYPSTNGSKGEKVLIHGNFHELKIFLLLTFHIFLWKHMGVRKMILLIYKNNKILTKRWSIIYMWMPSVKNHYEQKKIVYLVSNSIYSCLSRFNLKVTISSCKNITNMYVQEVQLGWQEKFIVRNSFGVWFDFSLSSVRSIRLFCQFNLSLIRYFL